MLSFYFDFMKYYFHDDKFAYVAMDTDCADFATSDSLEKEIISTKRLEFDLNYDKWFFPPCCSKHKSDLVQCNDQNWNMDIFGEEAFQFHKRTPGLYKDEFQGTGIIDLYTKT